MYSFPLARSSCPCSAGVLHALLCLKVCSWCIHGERCTPCLPTPPPFCSPFAFFKLTYYKRSYKHFLHCPFLLEKVFWTILLYSVSLISLLLHKKSKSWTSEFYPPVFLRREYTFYIQNVTLGQPVLGDLTQIFCPTCCERLGPSKCLRELRGQDSSMLLTPLDFSCLLQLVSPAHCFPTFVCCLHRSQPRSSSSTFQTCV